MSDYESLNHATWDCKYHIVWIPKYRKKKLYEKIRVDLSHEIKRLAECRESAIYVARKYGGRTKYFSGQHMWARGYFVSTVGMNEEVIRKYIQNQENEDKKNGSGFGLVPRTEIETRTNRFERFTFKATTFGGG